MQERVGAVTFGGKPLTLLGDQVKEGDRAPDFTVIGKDLGTVHFSSFQGKVCVVSSVPSLDTPVCAVMTKRFNDEAIRMDPDVQLLTISMDLPFAQARWRGEAGVTRVQTFSDHRDASFGTAYGVLIKELRLLARAVFVVDRQGQIRHAQIVKEIADEPDYDVALEAVNKAL